MTDSIRVQPRDGAEEAVAAIVREVLDVAEIGVFDDFFDLDGSSLQAVEVVSRVRAAWAVDVRARDFFASPTVAALAMAISTRTRSRRALVTPRPADADPVLSLDQERLWLEDQLVPGAAYNVHERRRITGPLDRRVVELCVSAVRERHEPLRTRFPTVDGAPRQVVDHPAGPAVAVVDLQAFPGDRLAEARRLADEQARTPFDLATDQPLRCLLVVLADDDHVLAVTAHHIACDNWSIMVFMREFVALYRAGGRVAGSGLPELRVCYRDYAVWQRAWLAGEQHAAQAEHWRAHLRDAPATLALPAERPDVVEAGHPAGRVAAALSADDTLAVGDLGRERGTTRFMIVLAATATVLGRWSGQSDVVVGVPIAGRTDPGLANMIGFLVNTLPLRIDVDATQTFDELLDQVRATALAGYANSDVPLNVVVREVQATRERGASSLFQVLLTEIDVDDVGGLDGLEVTPMEPPPNPSKIDLAFTVRSSGGQLRLELEFDAARYAEDMMGLLVGQVVGLIRHAADDPGRELVDYAL